MIYLSHEDKNNDWTISPKLISNCFCLNEAARQTSGIRLRTGMPGEYTSGDAEHCTGIAPLIRLVGGGQPHVKHLELCRDKIINYHTR